jgi:predicted DNA-binding protein
MNKRQLGIRIPNNLLERLDNYAVEHNTSKTDVVIGALAKYLESPESIPLGERIIAVEARVTKLEAQLSKMETVN